MTSYLRAIRVALGFLTTLPVPLVKEWREDDLRLAVKAYPLVGLVVGVLLALAFILFAPLAPMLRGVLITALWLLITGALHFDGFCDLADAAFAPKPPEERWRIVKDPRVGAFALAAGSLLILTKAAAVGALSNAGTLLIIPILSRSAVTWAMASYPVYDVSLLGRRTNLRFDETFLPTSLGVVLSLFIAVFWLELPALLFLILSAALSTLIIATWLNRQMAGLGGDAYGALVESSEAVMLVVATLF